MAIGAITNGNADDMPPMSELNTTPLIDVMLVLLVMFIITIPVATHSIPLDLPQGPAIAEPDPVKNRIVIDAQDRILWNGDEVTSGQLAYALQEAALMPTEPEIQFEPEPTASYAKSAHVLDIVKRSGVTKFGLTGNHQYRQFAKAE